MAAAPCRTVFQCCAAVLCSGAQQDTCLADPRAMKGHSLCYMQPVLVTASRGRGLWGAGAGGATACGPARGACAVPSVGARDLGRGGPWVLPAGAPCASGAGGCTTLCVLCAAPWLRTGGAVREMEPGGLRAWCGVGADTAEGLGKCLLEGKGEGGWVGGCGDCLLCVPPPRSLDVEAWRGTHSDSRIKTIATGKGGGGGSPAWVKAAKDHPHSLTAKL